MLTQAEADRLMNLSKRLEQGGSLQVVAPGDRMSLPVRSIDGREGFLVDMNRGRLNLAKCTWQERYRQTVVLIRLDVEGPPHRNPDGALITTPHLHVYREGYGTRWAWELSSDDFANPTDPARTLRDFLSYCKVVDIPDIQGSLL